MITLTWDSSEPGQRLEFMHLDTKYFKLVLKCILLVFCKIHRNLYICIVQARVVRSACGLKFWRHVDSYLHFSKLCTTNPFLRKLFVCLLLFSYEVFMRKRLFIRRKDLFAPFIKCKLLSTEIYNHDFLDYYLQICRQKITHFCLSASF